ncbi:hypothetical protein GmHk_04G010305 [Glycine max]|nr:hypothetical protein GmHk_04G010305 [Glycine max]
MQSQGLQLPLDHEVGPSVALVSTKESCVERSGNHPQTGDSDKCGLYIEGKPSRLVALGRLYEGSATVHNMALLHGQVKVVVEEIIHADALHVVPPTKPPHTTDPQVHDPLYLMTLTIPQLFLKPLKVMWDASLFGLLNSEFPLYIKHEDLSEIVHGGQCLSISVIQLWILYLTGTSMRLGNSDVESQTYINNWIHSSKRHVYLGAYLDGLENVVAWFCSLHHKPDNYLKGIINRSVLICQYICIPIIQKVVHIVMFVVFNSALKGVDGTPQPKSKVAGPTWIVFKCNKQKGSTECGYYVMHWMSTIILASFTNNWEMYFNDARPLESDTLKTLRIQWAKYYLKVRNET